MTTSLWGRFESAVATDKQRKKRHMTRAVTQMPPIPIRRSCTSIFVVLIVAFVLGEHDVSRRGR
eukprot:5966184-Lingulodinium_polyedra.AAC.1